MTKSLGSIYIIFLITINSHAQSVKNPKTVTLSGVITLTNNGFSNIPSFSLGRPAAIFNLAVAGKKTSFEPELRFSLEGKPWSFLFWIRHKIISTSRYHMSIGIHPGFNFKYQHAVINGVSGNYIVNRRYLTQELNQSYVINKSVSMSFYYMYGRGLDPGTTKNTHFLSMRSSFSKKLPGSSMSLRINPQFYYLITDDKDGFFVASTFGLYFGKFPISIGSMMNKKIAANLDTNDFNWNIGINYAFGSSYQKKE